MRELLLWPNTLFNIVRNGYDSPEIDLKMSMYVHCWVRWGTKKSQNKFWGCLLMPGIPKPTLSLAQDTFRICNVLDLLYKFTLGSVVEVEVACDLVHIIDVRAIFCFLVRKGELQSERLGEKVPEIPSLAASSSIALYSLSILGPPPGS